MFGRNKIAMVVAEFLGTGILTAAVIAMTHSQLPFAYFIAIGAGLVVAAMTLVLGGVSGAHLNPAITIGLWSARRIKTFPAIVYIGVQLLGGMSAYLLYSYLVDVSWGNKGVFDSRVMVAEVVGAFIFSLGWAAAVYHKMDVGRAAAVVGSSLAIGIIVASMASAGLLNPAVALGSRMWVWGTYVLGPILGAVIGFNLYALLFAPSESLIGKAKTAVVKSVKSVKKKKK